MIDLYQRVVVNRDIPEANLQAGDLAWLIDYVAHPEGGEAGCVLEVFNALGESITVTTVPQSAVEPLRADQVPTVRTLTLSHS
jgi:hypothetical protein